MLLKRILTNMNASQLYPRVKRLFYDSKRLGKFKWGDRSNVMAHACVYIVARQVNKPVTINEIAVSPLRLVYSTFADLSFFDSASLRSIFML